MLQHTSTSSSCAPFPPPTRYLYCLPFLPRSRTRDTSVIFHPRGTGPPQRPPLPSKITLRLHRFATCKGLRLHLGVRVLPWALLLPIRRTLPTLESCTIGLDYVGCALYLLPLHGRPPPGTSEVSLNLRPALPLEGLAAERRGGAAPPRARHSLILFYRRRLHGLYVMGCALSGLVVSQTWPNFQCSLHIDNASLMATSLFPAIAQHFFFCTCYRFPLQPVTMSTDGASAGLDFEVNNEQEEHDVGQAKDAPAHWTTISRGEQQRQRRSLQETRPPRPQLQTSSYIMGHIVGVSVRFFCVDYRNRPLDHFQEGKGRQSPRTRQKNITVNHGTLRRIVEPFTWQGRHSRRGLDHKHHGI